MSSIKLPVVRKSDSLGVVARRTASRCASAQGLRATPVRKGKGEKLRERVDAQLQSIADDPALVRSFFRHPSVAYTSDC